MAEFIPTALGWQRDIPDHRDYSVTDGRVKELLALARAPDVASAPAKVIDLREFSPPLRDQRALPTSPSHACTALVEYFERRASGRYLRLSPMFLYKTTRRLLLRNGETGVDLRSTLKAIVRFGLPPEAYAPYDVTTCDEEPGPFQFSSVMDFHSLHYVRLDAPPGMGDEVLRNVKAFLTAGFACVCGFPVPTSMSDDGDVPFPRAVDSFRGGQAVLVIGFDDRRRIGGIPKGALIIGNSWGSRWGEDGYGWLPYEYVQRQLAVDFWTILKKEWLVSGELEGPRLGPV
jgi:C1A family cysteine protease